MSSLCDREWGEAHSSREKRYKDSRTQKRPLVDTEASVWLQRRWWHLGIGAKAGV